MNAEILAVGTELLMGQISNTNAQYISEKLNSIGINVYFHSVVGDNENRLVQSLNMALNRSELIIITGGLGPTQDDITKETVAKVFGKKMILDKNSQKKIKCFFERYNKAMTKNNEKQAYFPENSIIVENKNGTAPGCIIEKDNKIVIMLPGPPKEMKPMFEEYIIPFLTAKSNQVIVSKFIKVFGIGESSLEDMLIDLISTQKEATIAPYANSGQVTLRVTTKANDVKEGEKHIQPVINKLKERIGGNIYSYEGEEFNQVIGKKLIETGTTISVAESCTGGMLANLLTEVPGISEVFDRGIISYSNKSKVENLNVSQAILDKYGAVSKEVAIEMAQGIKKVAQTDIGVGITGVAGPGGGSEEKPVGLVYIAAVHKEDIIYKELRLVGNRDKIRNMTCLHVFDILRKILK